MDLELVFGEALRERPEAMALACVDAHTGIVLGASCREESFRRRLPEAALAAAQLCAAPRLDVLHDEESETEEALLVSNGWVHVCARGAPRRELILVGIAAGRANVALLAAWVRDVRRALEKQWA
jgi:hypothetical protein